MSKTELIFHLGLTKNASTFLQRKIFNGKMNTLKRSIDWEDDKLQAKEFQETFRTNSPRFWEQKQAAQYFARYASEPSLGPVIISHESLYEHVPFAPPLRHA